MTTTEFILLIVGTSGLSGVLQGLLTPRRSDEAANFARVESKLNRVMDHLGLAHDTPIDQVQDLVRRSLTINAIKLYCEQIGCGLADAKEAVLRIKEQMTLS